MIHTSAIRFFASMRSIAFLMMLLASFFVGCSQGDAIEKETQKEALFKFESNDVIAIVGNGLAERMQHDGWIEAALQLQNPDSNLSFYNLGFGADELTVRQRTSGFGSMDDYLERSQATVVFAFFGYNESFSGVDGMGQFRKDLSAFVDRINANPKEGGKARRLVLFTTSAFENLDDKNLPNGEAANARLAQYNSVIVEVAKAQNVACVELFDSTQKMMRESKAVFTINGLHLNELGNRFLAQSIATQLSGTKHASLDAMANDETLQKLRKAVVVKNELWFQRYRATDGYNVYGGRSSLKFVGGVTNRVVLQEEMQYLDESVKRHTKNIWALAKGIKSQPDLDGLPILTPVVTNIPGENPDGSHRFKSGVGAIEDMTMGDGLKISLFASEEEFPELVNPVQMSWDNKGRLWVAVWPTYPHWKPDQPMNDKLIILEDTDGDGRADTSTVFADKLHNPTGFEFWQGGVFIANAPDLLFLKDNDGDDVADERRRVIHGLSSADTHHSANSFVFGQDGALYFQEGTFHQTQIETIYGPVRNRNGCVWRFEPRTWRMERHVAYNFANPHGHVFDRWGQNFVTDGTGNQNYYALAFSGHVVHPRKHPGYGTFFPQRCRPAAATEILSSQSFGPDFEGDYLIANVIGFRGILRYQVQDDKSGFGAKEEQFIVQSKDENFRPSDLEVGPDGALYFLDWHNPIIGHMQHHLRDPSRDVSHGRVYRVTGPKAGSSTSQPIAGRPTADLLQLLKSPENRVRYRVRAELSARSADEVLAEAKKLLSLPDAGDEHFYLELLWLHQQFNRIDEDLLAKLLNANDFRARAATTRVVRGMRHKIKEPLKHLLKMAGDSHPRVRLEAVVAASFFESAEAATVALETVSYPRDRFLNYALKETLITLEPYWQEAVKQGDLVARKPEGQSHLLRQINPEDLDKLPKVPAVWRALLTRNNVALQERTKAAAGLAESVGTNHCAVVCDAILALDKQDNSHKAHILTDLAQVLQINLEDVSNRNTENRARLLNVAQTATTGIARRAAAAGIMAIDRDLEKSFDDATVSTSAMESFLKTIPLLKDEALRASISEKVRPLIFDPGRAIDRSNGEVPGIQVAYYGELPKSAKLSDMNSLSPEVVGRVSRISLNIPQIKRADGFSLKFTGKIRVTSPGEYRFFTASDDGSCLYVDGSLVVDNDGPHGTIEKAGKITLDAGLHDLEVTYFESGGDQSLRASWAGPGIKKQQIPESCLVTDSIAAISQAATQAVASMPGFERMKFRDAARLFGAGRLVEDAVGLVQSVSRAAWPEAELKNVVDSIAGFAAGVPSKERTTPRVLAALSIAKTLASGLSGEEAGEAMKILEGLSGSVILVRTLPHRMLYDRREIWVEAGKPVAIVFQNNDVMPHNLVITKTGKMQIVGEAAEKLPSSTVDFVPKTSDVLWFTKLVKPGDSTRLTFIAPDAAVELPFVCTFPGHWRVMNGVIHVVDQMGGRTNVAIESENTEACAVREFVKLWTTEELNPALIDGWTKGRSLERGKILFAEAGCIQCHQTQGLGENVLLDLSKIGDKYQPVELLSQIIEPSKDVLEGYENYMFDTENSGRVIGRIQREDGQEIAVSTEMQDPTKITVVAKKDITFRKKLKLSLMPTGLLVTMTKAEILDLLNFLIEGSR
ncbi:MAG: putative heme-binding domain-containing protein [Planctomycetota bacterium]|jgi:putative heme-binding domain-containing protein